MTFIVETPETMSNPAASHPLVGVIMGSKSDWETLHDAVSVLRELGVPCEAKIVSAHRTPKLMVNYAQSAAARGLEVLIAGAGGAALWPASGLPR